jgi:hypothetical protein
LKNICVEPAPHNAGSGFPPRPDFAPLVTDDQRAAMFGRFDYRPAPRPDNKEAIRILGGWVERSIVDVPIPQLRRAMGNAVPHTIPFHRLAARQLQGLWSDWENEGLLNRVLTWHGGFVPRFVRGSTTRLSNHAFGTAFDINSDANPYGGRPPLVGEHGSVRELVPTAHRWGFYWGGHYRSKPDGMHFEVAFLK